MKYYVLIFMVLTISCNSVNLEEVKRHSWKNNGETIIRFNGQIYEMITFRDYREQGFYLDHDKKVYYKDSLIGKVISGSASRLVIEGNKGEVYEFVNF